MNYIKYALILIGIVMLGSQFYSFLSIDENQIKALVSGGVPIRFIQADEETLDILRSRLKELTPFSASVLAAPRTRNFGRRGLFVPDKRSRRSR